MVGWRETLNMAVLKIASLFLVSFSAIAWAPCNGSIESLGVRAVSPIISECLYFLAGLTEVRWPFHELPSRDFRGALGRDWWGVTYMRSERVRYKKCGGSRLRLFCLSR